MLETELRNNLHGNKNIYKGIIERKFFKNTISKMKNLKGRFVTTSKTNLKSTKNLKKVCSRQNLISSQSGLFNHSKEKLVETSHDTMLQKELQKFRKQIEAKFNASEINGIYKFPREGSVDDTHVENLIKNDCIESVKFVVTTVRANTTDELPKKKRKASKTRVPQLNHYVTLNSSKKSVEKCSSKQEENTKVNSENNTTKVVKKIKTLVHSETIRNLQDKTNIQEFNSVKDSLAKNANHKAQILVKHNLMATQKNLHTLKATKSIEKKRNQSSVRELRKQLSQKEVLIETTKKFKNRLLTNFMNPKVVSNKYKCVLNNTALNKDPDYFTTHKINTSIKTTSRNGKEILSTQGQGIKKIKTIMKEVKMNRIPSKQYFNFISIGKL